MKKLLVIGALAFGLSALQTQSAVLFPSLMAPLRSAILDEMFFLTNSPSLTPEETRQLRLLTQARRNIDRPGRPSLFGDVQILASLTTSLTHAFPGGEFDPLLQTTIGDYAALLGESAFTLADTISTLPPSTVSPQTSNTVAGVIAMLEQLDPFASVTAGIRTITLSAARLRSAETFVNRARSTLNRRSRFTALVDGRRFAANSVGGISANYNAAAQSLAVVGRESGVGLSGNRSIQLVLNDVTPGTTTHALGAVGAGSYAIYSANSLGLPSLSGNVIVTLNAASGLVTGRFSFNAGEPFSGQTPVRVTGGDFSVQLPSP